MTHVIRLHATVFEDTCNVFMARVRGMDGALITQSVVSSITCSVTDGTSGTQVAVITPSVDVSTAVYDTIQTGSPWDTEEDATGFNFKYIMPATAYPTAGHLYTVLFTFTATDGSVFGMSGKITAEAA